jgi:gamma-D-glutamyl-L-lysine dipeptidyl-peptidase
MKRVICQIPLIPIRYEPSHRSEMVSQLLFGECAEILEETENWLKIKCEFDGYIGWLESKSVVKFESEINKSSWIINSRPILKVKYGNEIMFLPGGAEYPLPDADMQFIMNGSNYALKSDVNNKPVDLLSSALDYLNSPYLWGGRSVFGIDCSGFIQIIFKINGIMLPRDAKDQSEIGITVNYMEEAKAGDLFYFHNETGQIVHVGMLLDESRIIHASGSVRIDTIDNRGIYNENLKKYTHNLSVIKRIVEKTIPSV